MNVVDVFVVMNEKNEENVKGNGDVFWKVIGYGFTLIALTVLITDVLK